MLSFQFIASHPLDKKYGGSIAAHSLEGIEKRLERQIYEYPEKGWPISVLPILLCENDGKTVSYLSGSQDVHLLSLVVFRNNILTRLFARIKYWLLFRKDK